MKKHILTLILGLCWQLAVGQKNQLHPAAGFDSILSRQFKPAEPGATVLVARDGRIIYHKAVGMANMELDIPMQPDNVFRIGSITKQFTAVAILQLVEQGQLSLQDELTKFIPDYPTQGHKITVEHLLTHTSGIYSYTALKDYIEKMSLDMTPLEIMGRFKDQPLEFAPGTSWKYSNSGYQLLGYIIEKVTGKTYAEYVEEQFFKPLGMTQSLYGSNSRIVRNRVGGYSKGAGGFENAKLLSMTQPYAAGSIQSTVGDLFKWHQAAISHKLIGKEMLDKAFSPFRLADGKETSYGYGWRFRYLQGSPTIEHNGGINGALTTAIYLPREDVFVAVFSNCDCHPAEDAASRLAALAIGKPYEHKEMAVAVAMLPGYTGVYENDKGDRRIITAADNKLYSQRGGGQKFLVKAYEKDRFYFDDALLTFGFVRNNAGEVEKLIAEGREGSEVWVKTNKPVEPVSVKLAEQLMDSYVGEYKVAETFSFTITREQDRVFVQATGQEKIEIFSEEESKFFTKVNDARFEFIRDNAGRITKVSLRQSGRSIDAKKIR